MKKQMLYDLKGNNKQLQQLKKIGTLPLTCLLETCKRIIQYLKEDRRINLIIQLIIWFINFPWRSITFVGSVIKFIWQFLGYLLNKKRVTQSIEKQGRIRGLVNLGNTCFMNSALQCLLSTKQLQIQCHKSFKQFKGPLQQAFLNLCNKDTNRSYKPSQIRQIIATQNRLFQGYNQHDSCEWMTSFLNKLHLQTNQIQRPLKYTIDQRLRKRGDKQSLQVLWKKCKERDQSREKSIIDEVIFGRFKVTYQCIQCSKIRAESNVEQERGLSVYFEKFHIVYLPIPQDIQTPSLSDCFDDFCKIDNLEGENKMNCDQCQSQKDTQKRMTIYETNQILILCMKRFGNQHKNLKMITVPKDLSRQFLQKYENRQEDASYSLYAMIHHVGSMKSGHYTAICCDQSNKWMHYNDQHCKESTQEAALNYAQSAYVLFYRKKAKAEAEAV